MELGGVELVGTGRDGIRGDRAGGDGAGGWNWGMELGS